MKILTLNCGSSSVKYGLWEMPGEQPLAQGLIERVGLADGIITHTVTGRDPVRRDRNFPTHGHAIEAVFEFLTDESHGVVGDVGEIDAAAHRVVHGGEQYTHSVLIDDDVITAIEDNALLAPLHNPNNLAGIHHAMTIMPDKPHTASWDTAFSAAFMPDRATMYAIPYEYYERFGIRRFGYQGLSHLYVTRRAAALMGEPSSDVNIVSLHIGNGSTVTAVAGGMPVDQSLGFSTCGEGLVMGTRCGDLDPTIPLFLMKHAGLSADEAEDILYRKSGVLGLSGRFVDRREIIDAATAGDTRAELALEVECYRIRKYIGSYSAAMGGIDAVVFTAGVGENSAVHRAKACEGLEFLGIEIDDDKNRAAFGRTAEAEISTADSRVKVFVIPTDEELVMAVDAEAIIEDRYDIPTRFRYTFEESGFVPTYLRMG
ncbi:MAG: acetate kinase [Acidimicrobiia bacterium]|nr:acetate kinase [Acidimicrobiia bacterium]